VIEGDRDGGRRDVGAKSDELADRGRPNAGFGQEIHLGAEGSRIDGEAPVRGRCPARQAVVQQDGDAAQGHLLQPASVVDLGLSPRRITSTNAARSSPPLAGVPPPSATSKPPPDNSACRRKAMLAPDPNDPAAYGKSTARSGG